MKTLSILFFGLLTLSACSNQSQRRIKSFQFEVDEVLISTKIARFGSKGDGSELEYCVSNECTRYSFKGKIGTFISSSGDTTNLVLKDELQYLIKGKNVLVSRYINDLIGSDNRIDYFYSKEFGMILMTTQWKDFSVFLGTNDDETSTELAMIILQDQL